MKDKDQKFVAGWKKKKQHQFRALDERYLRLKHMIKLK